MKFSEWLVGAIIGLAALTLMPSGRALAQEVAVTAADPSTATQGTLSLDVTVSGSGFDSTAQVNFLVTGTTNPGGISVKKVAVRGSKKLIATIDVADTASVDKFDIEVVLSNGRKGKGTTLFTVQSKVTGNDSCATTGLDFPAFVYWQQSGYTQQIYVADASGQCSRPLYLVTDGYDGGSSLVFSYPVDGTIDRGRVLWREGLQIVGGDFVVSGTSVTFEPRRTVLSSVDCCALELAPDGASIFVSTNQRVLERVSLADTSVRSVVRTIPDDGWFQAATVNGEESMLYVDEHRRANGQLGGAELIRINLDTLEASPLPLQGSDYMSPAADHGSDLIVYTDYLAGSNNCFVQQIADGRTGETISYGQLRYGRFSTWYAGKILTNGRKLQKGGRFRCDGTGMITEIDPLTSEERELTRGYDPDGK